MPSHITKANETYVIQVCFHIWKKPRNIHWININLNLYTYYMTFDFIYISGSLVVLSVDHLNMNKTTNYIRIMNVEEVITQVLNFEGDLH